jgi:hypothetical protein
MNGVIGALIVFDMCTIPVITMEGVVMFDHAQVVSFLCATLCLRSQRCRI